MRKGMDLIAKVFWKEGGVSCFVVGIAERKFFSFDGSSGVPKELFMKGGRVRAILYSIRDNPALNY